MTNVYVEARPKGRILTTWSRSRLCRSRTFKTQHDAIAVGEEPKPCAAGRAGPRSERQKEAGPLAVSLNARARPHGTERGPGAFQRNGTPRLGR
jgi:hypothetical protein